jgi:hypothetical protein
MRWIFRKEFDKWVAIKWTSIRCGDTIRFAKQVGDQLSNKPYSVIATFVDTKLNRFIVRTK